MTDTPAPVVAEVRRAPIDLDDWRILRERQWDYHDQHLIVRPYVDELVAEVARLTAERDEARADKAAHLKQIKDLENLAAAHRHEITVSNDVVRRKNLELDALHFVWCSGPCGEPVTKEIVDEAVRNTDRLIQKFNGQQSNRAWRQLHDYPEDQKALESAWRHAREEKAKLTADLAVLRTSLRGLEQQCKATSRVNRDQSIQLHQQQAFESAQYSRGMADAEMLVAKELARLLTTSEEPKG